jgi:predicted small lipoprotein YifL
MKKVLWIMVVMVLTLPILNGCGVRGSLSLPDKDATSHEPMDKKNGSVVTKSHEEMVK